MPMQINYWSKIEEALTKANEALADSSAGLNADLVAKLATLDPAVNPYVSSAALGIIDDQGGGGFAIAPVVEGDTTTPVWDVTLFASANPLYRWRRDLQGRPLDVRCAGAKGDGTTNDTAALQAAMDAGAYLGCVVQGHPGDTYMVSKAGSTFNGYALKMKDGTRVDLNGSTIKLDDNQWCSVIINGHILGGGTDHVELGNGTIDGNEAGQTRHWTGTAFYTLASGGVPLTCAPTVCMFHLSSPRFENLTIKNGYIYTLYLQQVTRLYAHGITLAGGYGDGFLPSLCYDSDIDDLYAYDFRPMEHQPAWGSSWGQGFCCDLARANIGTVRMTNCTGPIKVQGGSTDIVWDKLFVVAGPLTGTANEDGERHVWFGIKIQGEAPTPHNARIKIGSIVCDASDPTIDDATQTIGAGVYVVCSDDVEIDSYRGVQCGRGGYPSTPYDAKDWSDIVVHNAPRLKIGSITTDHCGHGVIVSQNSEGGGAMTESISIGSITCVDPRYAYRTGAFSGPYLLNNYDCHMTVGTLRLTESSPPPFPTSFLYGGNLADDLSASIHIGEAIQNQPLNARMFVNDADADVARVTVGRVRVDGLSKPAIGVATLTDGEGSTAVTCDEISSWDALSPIIATQPANSSAAALGNMTAVPNIAPDTGLVLSHNTAGASDKVSWQSLGYSSLSGLILPRAWATLSISGSKPPVRGLAAACYVPTLDLSLLFGGISSDGSPLGDTWAFNHSSRTWTQLSPSHSPSARYGAFMCYDSTRDRVVLFGGQTGSLSNETWEYYDGDWHQVTPATTSPDAQYSLSSSPMCFDSSRNVTVLYGGHDLSSARWWEYNGSDWSEVGSALANDVYRGASLVFNPLLGVTVAFGGYLSSGIGANDIYSWNGTTATHQSAGEHLQNCSAAWDSNRGLIIIGGTNGGAAGSGIYKYTMQIDNEYTMSVLAAELPSSRSYCAGVYCPTMSEVMLFGGSLGTPWGDVIQETIVYRRG